MKCNENLYITIEYAFSYGTSIGMARRLTDAEKERYAPEWRDLLFIGIGDDQKLDFIELKDMPHHKADGAFLGCNNMVYIISEAERDEYIRLNAERKLEAERKEREKEIKNLLWDIKQAEKQHDLPTREEAIARMKRYNDVQNEGYESFVPYIYDREQYDAMVKRLDELTGQKYESKF